MDQIELYIIANHTALSMGGNLAQSPNGEYTIPDLSMADTHDDRMYLATYITMLLSREYPEFQFSKSEKLFPEVGDGLTIRWYKKPEAVERKEHRMEIEE